MPNPKNINRLVETTSPYNTSTNAQLVKNTNSQQIDGVAPSSQAYKESYLTSEDWSPTNQSQEQTNHFVSKTDKTIYPISYTGNEVNEIKELESDVGVVYNYLSDTTAEEKYQRVKLDYTVTQKTISNLWGDVSYQSKLESIENDFTVKDNNKKIRLLKNRNLSWANIKNKGKKTQGKSENVNWSVRLSEEQSEDLVSKGKFTDYKDPVVIEVYSMVNNFDFGTSQNFEEVSPRGSQTPMRFYNYNVGRILRFTAEFHQQEYPRTPLLVIAENAQYLARPYKHGDYSVIPKLVRIEIPGRVFRGYLTEAGINYSGDDYSRWSLDNINASLDNSTLGYPSDVWNESTEGKVAVLSQETLDYGLSKITVTFTLAIVEEIKLATYMTNVEIEEQNRPYNEARKEVYKDSWDVWEADASQIYAENPLRPTYDVDQLIIVNESDGSFVGYYGIDINTDYYPENYTELLNSLPEGTTTLEQLKAKEELRESNPQNTNAKVFISENEALEYIEGNRDRQQLIQDILTLEEKYGPSDPPITREELENPELTMEDLSSIRNDQILSVSENGTDKLYVVQEFSSTTTDKQGRQIEENYLDKFPQFKDVLSFTIQKGMVDCQGFLKLINYGGVKNQKIYSDVLWLTRNPDKKTSFYYYYCHYYGHYPTSYGTGCGPITAEIKEKYGITKYDNSLAIDFTAIPVTTLDRKYSEYMVNKNKRYLTFTRIRRDDVVSINEDLLYIDSGTGKEDDTIIVMVISLFREIIKSIPTTYSYFIDYILGAYPEFNNIYIPSVTVGRKSYGKDYHFLCIKW